VQLRNCIDVKKLNIEIHTNGDRHIQR